MCVGPGGGLFSDSMNDTTPNGECTSPKYIGNLVDMDDSAPQWKSPANRSFFQRLASLSCRPYPIPPIQNSKDLVRYPTLHHSRRRGWRCVTTPPPTRWCGCVRCTGRQRCSGEQGHPLGRFARVCQRQVCAGCDLLQMWVSNAR